jgi:hypothetical protein
MKLKTGYQEIAGIKNWVEILSLIEKNIDANRYTELTLTLYDLSIILDFPEDIGDAKFRLKLLEKLKNL